MEPISLGSSRDNLHFDDYDSLGQYEQALEFYQQALAIAQEISDRLMEETTLNNLRGVYDKLGRDSEAELLIRPGSN